MKQTKFIGDFKDILKDIGGDGYLVGGFVRDKLINKNSMSKDIDIIYDGNIIDLISCLKIKSYNFFKNDEERDTYVYDGKEFFIKISKINGSSIEEDLRKRDFTINAICLKMIDNKIIDLFKGRRAIEARIIQQVTDESIVNDPIRILRGIRFYVKYGMHFSLETENCITENAYKLKEYNDEKIIIELMRIIECDKYGKAFELLYDYKIITNIFPYERELIKNKYTNINLIYQTFKDIMDERLYIKGLDIKIFEKKLGKFQFKNILSLVAFLNELNKSEFNNLEENINVYSKLGFDKETVNLISIVIKGEIDINKIYNNTTSLNKELIKVINKYYKYIPFIISILFCNNYSDLQKSDDEKNMYIGFLENIIEEYKKI